MTGEMAMASPSDADLVRYLLGTADRDDEERFDELSVTDAAFAERLRAIEHDLADAYVRGELSPSDRARWEARYLASPHGRDDLALAEALAARDETPAPRRSWIPWGFAAAAMLFVTAVAGYLVTHQAPGAPQTVARQPEPLPAGRPAEAQPPVAHIVALTLAPSVRSIQEPPTLTIPRGTSEVKLTLRLEGNEYNHYSVALRDLTSNSVEWRSSEMAAEGSDANRSLVVSIPASTFQTRRYLISVSAGPSDVREIVATYPFVVVLQ
jgi:hypothetical protein